jgi:hypothetical protein
MFTVVIAEKRILELFDTFQIFLKPLLNNDEVVWCEWHKDGKTIDQIVPDLYEKIAFQSEWRAVILNEDGLNQINPFDYTNYKDCDYSDCKNVWEKLSLRRKDRFECFDKAINNPLTKLTSALCGTPVYNVLVQDKEIFDGIVSGNIELYRYMLKLQFAALDLPETAAMISLRGSSSLLKFVREEDIDSLLEAIKNDDEDKIIDLVKEEGMLSFIKFIGNHDPFYSDPEYVDCIVENTRKTELFEAISKEVKFKDKLPCEVVCVAPRTYDTDTYNSEMVWNDNDEVNYSKFSEFNLYPEKVKYFVFDLLPEDHKQYTFDKIKMLSFILILAGNMLPKGIVASRRLYKADMDFDVDELTDICAAYLGKLKATKMYIKDLQESVSDFEQTPLENHEARDLIDTEPEIPVMVESSFDRNQLMAKYDQIGLSEDCPGDEYGYWDSQYRSINKMFVRYLREPRRALRKAVTEDFRRKNSVKDERVLRMTDFQLEDVMYNLQEKEQQVVETKTTQLYKTAQYKKELEKADKEVRRSIRQRMSRRHTITTGAIAIAAYAFGFLPLILSNVNTIFSIAPSLIVAGSAVLLFMIVGMRFLAHNRRKIINRFKHFNYVMSGILLDIDSGLSSFSEYLKYLCNVMRDFSMLEYSKGKSSKTNLILRKHEIDLDNQIAEVTRVFANYMDSSHPIPADCEPYDYDFCKLNKYDFDVPYPQFARKIEYMQEGHQVYIPISYVKSVEITREELYDR